MNLSTIERSAKAGDAAAQYTLGEMYYNGDLRLRPDHVAAAIWLRKAAEQGHPEAQWQLGIMYWEGYGVPRDDAAAFTWLRKAADQGHAHAQFNVGSMYRQGEGVPRDLVEAAAWLRKAADLGSEAAQAALGVMYSKGEGVPQDQEQANAWWSKVGARSRAAGEERREESDEMTSLDGCGQSLVRDPVVIRAFKKSFPDDAARRIKRLRGGGPLADDELALLDDLVCNEGRDYLRFHGNGADYDEDDPSEVDLYPIDVVGLGGIYFVRGNEFGDSGFFDSLDKAESYVSCKWAGVVIFGPDKIRLPFGVKQRAKTKTVKKKVRKKKIQRNPPIKKSKWVHR